MEPSLQSQELKLVQANQINAELDRKLFDLQALLKTGVALHDQLDVKAPCQLLMAMCQERLGVGRLAVLVHDPEEKIVMVEATAGLPTTADQLSFPATDGILWRLLRAGDPFSVVDLGGEPRFRALFEQHRLGMLQSSLWVPLNMPDRLVGVLSIGARDDGATISDGELSFLSTLANQAAVAINTARLYQSIAIARRNLDRSLHHLSLLFDITRALGAVSNLTRLLRLILERAIDAVNAEKGSLMLLDEAAGELVLRVIYGLPDKELESRINDGDVACKRFRRGEGVAGKVLESGKPLRVDDTGKDSAFTDRGSSNNVRSILCVPLNVDGETIGVINITNRKGLEPFRDEDEEILGALADQAAVAIARARLYEAAITDGLTSLYVRRFALHRLGSEIKRARRYHHPLSLIMCDIDHFKRVNDTLGHPAGDAVIAAVASVLRSGMRTDLDLAARYGGEEFLLILPETAAEGAAVAAERLRSAVQEHEVTIDEGKTTRVTMSFGIAELRPSAEETLETLLKRADDALYASKQQGRNRVTIHGAAPRQALVTTAEQPPATTSGPG
ncbi:MAG: sensor domain-containing diguanylate cyclase [Deltaproteobacteria bacterium]|nr:sensor domain-containing diguanylate cyclase [Deltaproteobacteria bacterium]